MITRPDWAILQDLLKLFEIFVHPTKKLQALTYPTLNYAILQYLQMIKKLKDLQQKLGYSSPIAIAAQKALDKLNEYYNDLNSHAHSSIATICDPRFNFHVF